VSELPRKRLIEEILPLADINAESSKSVSIGDIRTLHTWYARQPLAACRAATFAALVDAPATEKERDELMALIRRGILNTAPQQDKAAIEEMRELILKRYDGRAPTVLDPFAGGGSLALEALRLGCDATAMDLNPVALLTMLGVLDYPQRFANTLFPLPPPSGDEMQLLESRREGNLVEAVREWGRWVLEQVKPELQRFYPSEPDGGSVVAYLWAKTVRCTNPACGAEIPLVGQRWLSRHAQKTPVYYRLLPQLDRTLSVQVVEGVPYGENPSEGTTARGTARCLHCPQTLSPDDVKAQFQKGRDGRMMLVVVSAKPDEVGMHFRSANSLDRGTFALAEQELAQAEAAHDNPFVSLVPDEPIPVRSSGLRVDRYSVRTWGQLFNGRQALALTVLSRAIQRVYKELRAAVAGEDEAACVALYLAYTLTRTALRNSEATRWNNGGNKAEVATAGHRIAMVWDYAETNPIGNGTANWDGTNEFALTAMERLVRIGQPANVKWADATKLDCPDASFDAVLTDPPYYDSVCYADLSDFQYVWLHRTLGEILPTHFPSPLTPKQSEIIQEVARHGSESEAKQFYEGKLKEALTEIRRVLKPEGIVMVMYAHQATSAWETLVNALIGAGLQVTASWPVETQNASKAIWRGGTVLTSNIMLVCRKRREASIGYLDKVLPEMREEVRRALARFWAAGIGGADFFVSAIGPALSVFSKYGEVRYGSGQPVSVSNFLTLVRQAVVEHALEEALKGVDAGDVDRETQFALLWRWTYKHKEVETGAAQLLDKATGVELRELERAGLLARPDPQRMVLLGPDERPDLLEGVLRRVQMGRGSLLDALHCACMLWKENRRDELMELLIALNGAARQVAQALAELNDEGTEERKLLMGLLGAWKSLPAPHKRVAPPKPKPTEDLQLPLL
jgi:adenine-specific DNA methylase